MVQSLSLLALICCLGLTLAGAKLFGELLGGGTGAGA